MWGWGGCLRMGMLTHRSVEGEGAQTGLGGLSEACSRAVGRWNIVPRCFHSRRKAGTLAPG